MIDELIKECEEIQSFLEMIMSDDSVEVVGRGCDLASYMARTGKMLADAKKIYNGKKKEEIIEAISYISNCKLSGKVQNALVDSICQEEKYLVDWIDRLNATCTHQLDFCRSIISKNKEELRLSNLGREFK